MAKKPQHPNSRANLDKGMFKKGQSGNPSGKMKLPLEVRRARKLTLVQFQSLINQFIHMNKAELVEKASDPATTALEHLVLSIMNIGTKKGDEKKLDFLLTKLFGKDVEHINLTGNLNAAIVEKIAEIKRRTNDD